jgi:Cd2+/Zn2+-exporting ATPase
MCTIPWVFGADIGRYWTLNGLIIIVIACPCALTISTPVTYAAGLAATAQRGIIVKGGAKLEAMGSVDRIVFDKTGTLTKGTFSVTHLELTSDSKTRQQMLEVLALMQERSSHPLSSSLVQAAKDEGVNVPRHMSISNHEILKGEGITAIVDEKTRVYVGNKRLFARLGMFESLPDNCKILVDQWGRTGGTTGFIGSQEDGIIGMFCVKDVVREDARKIIAELKEARIDTMMCTGDSDAAAQAVAKEIGISSASVHSQLLPEDKLHFVGSLKRPQPRSFGICRTQRYVLFCGDGVNDAPALAVADIGVSMGEGAAMALEMSDITLMDSKLSKLTYAVQMGRRVLRTVKENIAVSLLAKFAVVLLTFAGKMTLLYAIASDVGIMLLVTLNGMKLLPNTSLLELASLRRRRRKAARQDFELVGTGKKSETTEETSNVAEIV